MAANRCVGHGLFTFSFIISPMFGFGTIVILTLDSVSSGRSAFLGDSILSRKPSRASISISGCMLALNTTISCIKLSVCDNQARPLQALPICSCVISKSLNNSHNRSHWLPTFLPSLLSWVSGLGTWGHL